MNIDESGHHHKPAPVYGLTNRPFLVHEPFAQVDDARRTEYHVGVTEIDVTARIRVPTDNP